MRWAMLLLIPAVWLTAPLLDGAGNLIHPLLIVVLVIQINYLFVGRFAV